MTINLRRSVADPLSRDVGNQAVQGQVVSKTVQFSMFTTNENACWAGNNHLLKASYPFATISLTINRNHFDLEVGDVFKLNYSKYGITGMICRVLKIEEEALDSENIIINCMEDIFSIARSTSVFTNPVDNSTQAPDYTPITFTKQTVLEAPYVLSESVQVVPIAKREASTDSGMYIYLSIDDGASYTSIGTANNIVPYGTLQANYGETNSIDPTGFQVDFPTTDIEIIQTITWAEALSSGINMLLIDDELMTFQTITPVSGTVYELSDVIRGRYGTEQASHLAGADVWVVNINVSLYGDVNFLTGSTRKFKLVPYNIQQVGSLADCAEISLTITGKVRTPYVPVNFCCNGVSFASRYTDDCVLIWNGRKRGEGAGIGAPGVALTTGTLEGTFDVKVYVSSVLVRTQANISTETWTYTEAMNLSDNGSLATEIEFRVTNHREEGGVTYTSDYASVTTKLTT